MAGVSPSYGARDPQQEGGRTINVAIFLCVGAWHNGLDQATSIVPPAADGQNGTIKYGGCLPVNSKAEILLSL